MKLLRLIMLLFFVFNISLKAQDTKKQEKIENTESIDKPAEELNGPENTIENKKENNLKPLVIKGRRVSIVERAGTTTTVTGKDIERRSDKLLRDVLYEIPGIDVSTQRNGTTKFSMRGYDMSRIAMLVDGIPLIDVFGGSIDIDNIGVMNNISEIVVTRGTASALYGTRAVAGSINIITKEPSEMFANFSAEQGEYGNDILNFSHGGPIGNFFYYISGTYDKSNGYEVSGKLDSDERKKWLMKLVTPYELEAMSKDYDWLFNQDVVKCYLNDTGLWDNTAHEKYKANAKLGYSFGPNVEVGVSSLYTYSEMQTSVYSSKPYWLYTYNPNYSAKVWYWDVSSHPGVTNSSGDWPEAYTYSVSPYLSYQNDKFKIKFNSFFYGQSNRFHSYADPESASNEENEFPDTATWSIWTDYAYGFQVYPSYRLSARNKLSSSLMYYKSNHTQEEKAFNSDATTVIYGDTDHKGYGTAKYKTLYIEAEFLTIALEDEMQITENLDFTAGLSYDAQNITKYQRKSSTQGSTKMIDQDMYKASMNDAMLWGTYDSFNPVTGIVYEPFQDFLKLRASASRKTSFPALRVYTLTDSRYQESEDTSSNRVKIKPEKSINANTGFELSFLGGDLTGSVDYFYSRYTDKIVRVWAAKSYEYYYRNIELALIRGMETIIKSKIINMFDVADIDLTFTYTYTHARGYPETENSEVNKGTRLEHVPTHKFSIDVGFHFISDTSLIVFGYYEYDQVQYVVGSNPTVGDTEFTTAYYTPLRLHDPLKINIKLSQKIYYDYEVYVMCKNVYDDYAADPLNPGPGRMWYGGFKANF